MAKVGGKEACLGSQNAGVNMLGVSPAYCAGCFKASNGIVGVIWSSLLGKGMPIRLAQIPKFYRIRGTTDLTTGRAFRYPKGYLIAPDGGRRPSHHGKDA